MTVKRRTDTDESQAYWDTVDALARQHRLRLVKEAIRNAIEARDELNRRLDHLTKLAKRLDT